MRRKLIHIGKKSKKSFSLKVETKKKNKVLKDYCMLLNKNKKLIINQNKKDLNNAKKKDLKIT